MKKKASNKKYQRKASNKKAMVITAAIVVFVMSIALTMTIWSSVAGVSPIALAKSWFVKPTAITYDGVNLFDMTSGLKGEDEFYYYNTFELKSDSNYICTFHADTAEGFDFEIGLVFLVLHDELLSKDVDIETLFESPDSDMILLLPLPTSSHISTSIYDYKYCTLLTDINFSASDLTLRLKIEENIVPTEYTAFGKGSTKTYNWRSVLYEVEEEPDIEYPVIEPTPIVVNTSIDALYLNTSAEADTILRSITPDADTGTNIVFNDEEGYFLCLMHFDESFDESGEFGEFSERMLFLQLPDETIIPVWISSFDTDFVNFLADMDIIVDTTANFQISNENLVALTGLTELSITHIGNKRTANYEMWGGQSNFNALFSSTPFAE